jgi:hypothetical protein
MRTFFLEDTDIRTKRQSYKSLSKLSESITLNLIESETLFLEAELSYQNIMIEAIRNEGQILLNEDEVIGGNVSPSTNIQPQENNSSITTSNPNPNTTNKTSISDKIKNNKGAWFEKLKKWFDQWIKLLDGFIQTAIAKVDGFMKSTQQWQVQNSKLLETALHSNFKYMGRMTYPNKKIPKLDDLVQIMTMVNPGSEGPKLQSLIDKERVTFIKNFKGNPNTPVPNEDFQIDYSNIEANLKSGNKAISVISKRINNSKKIAINIMNNLDASMRETENNPGSASLTKEEISGKKKSVMDMVALNKDELTMANKIMADSSKVAFKLISALKKSIDNNRKQVANGTSSDKAAETQTSVS